MFSNPRVARTVLALACAAIFTAANAAPAHAAPTGTPAAAAPVSTLDAFRWLVGGAWRADTSSLPGGLKYIETRYDLAPNGRLIRFTTKFVNGDGSVGNGYAGNLYFDPAARALRMWYLDSGNTVTQGPVTGDPAAWSMAFQSDGAIIGRPGPADFRVDVVRSSPDAYKWGLFAHVGDAWKPVFSLVYVRTAAG
jgi:hypothetical protein